MDAAFWQGLVAHSPPPLGGRRRPFILPRTPFDLSRIGGRALTPLLKGLAVPKAQQKQAAAFWGLSEEVGLVVLVLFEGFKTSMLERYV